MTISNANVASTKVLLNPDAFFGASCFPITSTGEPLLGGVGLAAFGQVGNTVAITRAAPFFGHYKIQKIPTALKTDIF